LKLKKRFGETKIKKIWDVNKIEKKPGDLNSPISPISKTSFFGEGFKNDSTQIDKLKTNQIKPIVYCSNN
jgi:hypothetical protein